MATAGRMSISMQQLVKHLLIFGYIIGNTYQQVQLSGCDCLVTNIWSTFQQNRQKAISCKSIDTAEKVSCAKRFITDKGQDISFVKLEHSNIDLFPDDFFPTYNVTEVEFSYHKMAGLSSRLLQPLCPSLRSIMVYHTDLRNKSIPAEAFGNCKQLQMIWISASGITSVSRKAFSGLADLRKLYLPLNEMESFEGFEGVHNLEKLHLAQNKIRFIDQNAFRGLNKLTRLYLSSNKLTTLAEGVFDAFINSEGVFINLAGNPFHCDCTLKWFQNWLQNSKITSEPKCESPIKGSLRTLNFCNITTQLPKTEGTTELPKTEGITHGLTTTPQSLPEGPGHTSDSHSWSIGLPLLDHILIVVNLILLAISSLG